MKGTHGRQRWLIAVGVYTVSGAIGAASVGIAMGYGALTVRRLVGDSTHLIGLVIVSSVILCARTVGLLPFPIPQCNRQTEKVWAHQFGIVIAAAMWGLHIGVGFLTRITYGGLWILVLAILAIGETRFAVGLMLAYWCGRVLPVLFAPLAWDHGDIRALLDDATFATTSYRRANAVALLWMMSLGWVLLRTR